MDKWIERVLEKVRETKHASMTIESDVQDAFDGVDWDDRESVKEACGKAIQYLQELSEEVSCWIQDFRRLLNEVS